MSRLTEAGRPRGQTGILYGGDYNPDQWPRDVWDEDVRLMREAHVNVATLPVFGWAHLEPTEGVYTFEWLDDILGRLADGGISVCLATATASVPAWVDQRYPDVLTADASGVKRRHGNRHTFCPNSPNFRLLSTRLARKMAERYRDHPALLLWHVSNEYGTYCYCDLCAAAFRDWLTARYGTLDELNARWYTAFWGHTYTDWAQVEPPYANGEGSIQAQKLDWHRFQSECLLNCYRAEAAVLREVTPAISITTNLMGSFFPLNYRAWAKEMDVVSWDNYPGPHDPPAIVAFNHALMRGLKEGQPFLLMEQSPSQQNWQPYNWLKPPGLLRLQSFQAVAQGSDSVMYFQWRRGRGGIEKLHGAIVEHHGRSDARVFREVAALGADVERLGTRSLGGRVPARVAILFDWESWWALRFSSGPSVDLDYREECRAFYAALHGLGIQTDVVAPDADLSKFDVILAPTLTLLTEENARRLADRVSAGATLLASFFSGLVDENDRVHPGGPPGPLRDVFGLWVEETDALPKGKANGVRFVRSLGPIEEGETDPADLLCDRLRLDGAETIAVYESDFYAGEPALTVNAYGAGRAYYLATRPDAAGLRLVLGAVCAEKDIVSPLDHGAAPPDGVEVTARVSPSGETLLYLLNHNTVPHEVNRPAGTYTDLLTGDTFTGAVPLESRAVRVVAVSG
jgi:beta-galactosidase